MNMEADFERTFDFIGDALCLDFANTLSERENEEKREEYLTDYSILVQWGEQAGILTPFEAQQLQQVAAGHLAKAESVRQRAIELREAIYRIFAAISANSSSIAEDLEILNAFLADGLSRLSVTPTADGFTWQWVGEPRALDWILGPVAWSAAQLLTSEELDRVGQCAMDDCSWLFLDRTRNRSRQWCDMTSCGNRAKARRYYQRQRSLS